MFTEGFEKTAGKIPSPARALGMTAGYTARGASAATKAGKKVAENTANVIKQHSKKQRAAFVGGFHEARGTVPAAAAKAGKTPKKSWAAKHPYMTAGLLYLGTKAMLSGSDDKQPAQPPQYVAPQY